MATSMWRAVMGSSSSDGDDPTLGGVEFWYGAQRSGWLTKQGMYIRMWRWRWVMLKQGRLFWFKDFAITRASVPRGVVLVSSCLTVKGPIWASPLADDATALDSGAATQGGVLWRWH